MIAWGMVAGYHPAQLPLALAVGSVGVVAVFLIVWDRQQAQASEAEGGSSGISSPNDSRTDPRPSCPVRTHVAVGSKGSVVFAVVFDWLAFAFGFALLREIRDPTPYGGGWDGW